MKHRSSSCARGAAGGFTMMEILVTLTLAAILLGIAVPSFSGFIASNRLVTQANDFVGAINYARSEAITRNTSILLCRADTPTSTNCSGSSSDWTNWIVRNPSLPAGSRVLRRGTVNSYGGTMRVTSDLTSDTMTFTSDGLARTSGVLVNDRTIYVCISSLSDSNFRLIGLGAGSRISTTKNTGTC